MPQVSRITDISLGVCYCHTSPVTYTSIFISGDPVVTVDGLLITRIGDISVCSCGHTASAISGSTISDSSSIPVHRIGDTGLSCSGSYITITGSPTTDSL